MQHLKTYRHRLTLYTTLLLTFLISILSFTYYSSRSILLEESGLQLKTTTQLIQNYLYMEQQDLMHYAEIVGADDRVQEYMFMVVKVRTDSEPLRALYQRHFGWLPVTHRLLITTTGRILLGKEYPELAMEVLDRITESKQEEVFYLQSSRGIDMVTSVPIEYQGATLGMVVLVTSIDDVWIGKQNFLNNGFLFIEHNGVIQQSNLEGVKGKSFKVDSAGYVRIDNELFRVATVLEAQINHAGSAISPRIWYGVSENNLLEKLSHHGWLILFLGILGSVGILLVGLMILRNFNQPLAKLTDIAQQVANGHLPVLTTATARNEIDLLSNQFAEMLQSLREKEQEVENVHRELQHSAITDSLTGLHNRRYLQEIFPKLFAQARRDDLYLFGILIDIDHFKQINDKHGHMCGDECLIHVAKTLQQGCRGNDYVFRVGGEEFFVLSLADNTDGGQFLAEKLRTTLEKTPARYEVQIIPMMASVGVNTADLNLPTGEAITRLLYTADNALYHAKSAGRNQVVIYQPSSQAETGVGN
ncbi:MAG: diguanylate cyclase [Thiohalomonadales bacterium]